MNKLSALLVLLAAAPVSADVLADAMTQAQASAIAHQQQALDAAVAEAQVDKSLMEDCMTLEYFPGMWVLRDDSVAIKADDGPAYRAVSRRLPFLRAAPGTKIELKPAALPADFDELKGDYAAALHRAGSAQRALGQRRQLVWALAEWGAESIVSSGPGKDYVQVLDRADRDAILAP